MNRILHTTSPRCPIRLAVRILPFALLAINGALAAAAAAADTQGGDATDSGQALEQVIPGARLFSGLTSQAMKVRRSAASRVAGVYGRGAAARASPTARAI